MSLPWFRMYAEWASDPVVQSLAFEDQRHHAVILCLKCNGTLDRDIADDQRERIIVRGLGLDTLSALEAKRRLLEVGLIDEDWQPRGWDKRQLTNNQALPGMRGNTKGYIYFIGTGPKSSVKIGYSKNPWARVKELQTGNHEPLQVLATVITTEVTTDTHIHAVFDKYRSNGEWFGPHEKIDEIIDLINEKKISSYKELLRINDVAELRSGIEQNRADTEQNRELHMPGLHPAPSAQRVKTANCPTEQLLALYHETLPMCPRVQKMTDTRERLLRSRWREHPDVELWRQYFHIVRDSKFLTGKTNGSRDRAPFLADFEWLIKPGNFAKVMEGRYDNR